MNEDIRYRYHRATADKDLEGPITFKNRVLFWDKKEGAYYDPETDLYLSQQQTDNLTRTFGDILSHATLLGWKDTSDDFKSFFTQEFEDDVRTYIKGYTTTKGTQ